MPIRPLDSISLAFTIKYARVDVRLGDGDVTMTLAKTQPPPWVPGSQVGGVNAETMWSTEFGMQGGAMTATGAGLSLFLPLFLLPSTRLRDK